MAVAKGSFTVKLDALGEPDQGEGSVIGRRSIDKQFAGDLVASSRGEMMSAGATAVPGSAGYVAIERVTGTLQGRQGSFVLMHRGVMNRGATELSVTVVPDTGSGELLGLSGSLSIQIEAGQHFYEFEYSLPEA